MKEPERDNWTHYERLGVAEDASPEEIRSAHRRLVGELHSDRKSGPYRGLFEELTKDVNAARDALLDPALRARYDAELAAERRRGPREEGERRTGAGTRSGSGTAAGGGPREGPTGDGGGAGATTTTGGRREERSSGARGEANGRRGTRPGAYPAGGRMGRAWKEVAADPVGTFVRVEDHPRWHLAGASAFVAALYPLALMVAWALGGALAALAAFSAVPILGLVAPSRLRRAAGRRKKAAGGKGEPVGAVLRLERAALIARALIAGPLLLVAVTLVASGTPAGPLVGVIEVLVNSGFVAAQLYPILWAVAGSLAVLRRLRRP